MRMKRKQGPGAPVGAKKSLSITFGNIATIGYRWTVMRARREAENRGLTAVEIRLEPLKADGCFTSAPPTPINPLTTPSSLGSC